MKKLCAIFCSLAMIGDASCEESQEVEFIRKVFHSAYGEQKGLSFEESYGTLINIKRDGRLIGYYVQSSVWQSKRIPNLDLSKVTRISYGANSKGIEEAFTITEQDELLLWCSVYKNHTEVETRYGHFIPLVKDAGFKETKHEVHFASVAFSSTGLRFFAGDKMVLELKGSLHESSGIESGMSNHALSNLVINEMRKIAQIRKEKEAKARKLQLKKEGEADDSDPFE